MNGHTRRNDIGKQQRRSPTGGGWRVAGFAWNRPCALAIGRTCALNSRENKMNGCSIVLSRLRQAGVLVGLFAAATSHAATYYVSTSGNNANAGTSASAPLRT